MNELGRVNDLLAVVEHDAQRAEGGKAPEEHVAQLLLVRFYESGQVVSEWSVEGFERMLELTSWNEQADDEHGERAQADHR